MTLYKQILAFVICLFAGLLVIAYAVQFQSTRDYLAEQQRIWRFSLYVLVDEL